MKQFSENKIAFFYNTIMPTYTCGILLLSLFYLRISEYFFFIGGIFMITISIYCLLSPKMKYIAKKRNLILLFQGACMLILYILALRKNI